MVSSLLLLKSALPCMSYFPIVKRMGRTLPAHFLSYYTGCLQAGNICIFRFERKGPVLRLFTARRGKVRSGLRRRPLWVKEETSVGCFRRSGELSKGLRKSCPCPIPPAQGNLECWECGSEAVLVQGIKKSSWGMPSPSPVNIAATRDTRDQGLETVPMTPSLPRGRLLLSPSNAANDCPPWPALTL